MKFLLSFLLLFCYQLTISFGQTTFCETSTDDSFTSGDESAAICLVFHGMRSNYSTENLFYFSTEVDEYTLNGLSGSQLRNTSYWEDEVKVQVEIGGVQSANRTIVSNGYAVTQIGIVIVCDNGKVDELSWDDGCFTCSGTSCIDDKNCGTKFTQCGSDCDFKIYTSWYGTDKDGDYLLSAGQRLSQFQSNTAQDYYNAVESEAGNLVDTANSVR